MATMTGRRPSDLQDAVRGLLERAEIDKPEIDKIVTLVFEAERKRDIARILTGGMTFEESIEAQAERRRAEIAEARAQGKFKSLRNW